MARIQTAYGPFDLRPQFARRHTGTFFEIEAWMPSEIKAISPLVDRLMRLIEGSHCVCGEEPTVELALAEALNNAVVHGNRMDRQKLVQVLCRCESFLSSSRIKDEDLTRTRCPIRRLPRTSAPTTGVASG